MQKGWTTHSEEETKSLGIMIADMLQPGAVVALQGPLGAGKTQLVKGIALGLGIDEATVHSPTYSLIHEYQGSGTLYHFDCYRLKSVEEALEIGAEDYFYAEGICVIEWPERIQAVLPVDTQWIRIEVEGVTQRNFTLSEHS